MSPDETASLLVERGRVVEPFEGGAWVQVERSSACGACAARSGCGTRALARWGQSRPLRVAIESTRPLAIGQEVSLGLPPRELASASLWTYGMPLGLALAGALGIERLGGTEPWVALGFAAGLLGGLLVLRRRLQRDDARYRPRLLEPPC
ncbi:SoxR reducing system RseC family protein [Halomonas organivorans]